MYLNLCSFSFFLIRRVCSEFSKDCEIGVENCFENEECKPIGARRKNGCCECSEGFIRNSNKTCILREEHGFPSTDSVETTLVPVTSVPLTTTTKYVRRLAIHISPTSIQLPETISNITAIVVPEPDVGEEYSYTWTVVAFPQDQQPGTVEGNKEKTLKLSQLSPGNYTLRVAVISPNSFGETVENLTVIARKHYFFILFSLILLVIIESCFSSSCQ